MNRFDRKPLPERFCNLERLLAAMSARGLDGIVLSSPLNVFYLSGFNGIAHKADEPRPYALVLSRHAPRASDPGARRLLPLELPRPAELGARHPSVPRGDDAARPSAAAPGHRPVHPARGERAGLGAQRARALRLRHGSALRNALVESGLEHAKIGFDDLGLAKRLGVEGTDAYDALMFARAVKTPTEIELLRRATALNREAIERTVKSWARGCAGAN